MKRLIYLFLLTAFLPLLLANCEDNRLEGIPEDGVCFLESAWQPLQAINDGKPYIVNFTVSKGGLGKSAANFSVIANQEVLDRYNEMNGTHYNLLPANCYSLTAGNQTIPAAGLTATVQVVFNLPEIIVHQEAGNENNVLPLQIVSDNEVSVSLEKGWVICAIQVENAGIGFLEPGWTTEFPLSMEGSGWTNVWTSVVLNYTPETNLTYTVERNPDIDQAFIDDYNTHYGFEYKLLPEDAYVLDPAQWKIEKDSVSGNFSIAVDRGKLMDTQGNPLFGKYVLPLKIADVSLNTVNRTAQTQLLVMEYNLVMFDRNNWKVLEWNSDLTMSPGYEGWNTGINNRTPSAMLESNTLTRWQSKLNDTPPYYFVFDMAEARRALQIRLLFPIGSEDWRGGPKSGYFEVSNTNNGSDWVKLSDWNRPYDAERVNAFAVPAATARYLRFTISEGFSNSMNIMEFQVWGTIEN